MPRFAVTLVWMVCALIIALISAPASLADYQVTLAWNAPNNSSNVAGYRLYLREAGYLYDYTFPVWQGPGTQSTIDQLDENTVYYFVVRAFDNNNNESGNSNEVMFPDNSSSSGYGLGGSGGSGGGGGGGAGCFISSLLAE